jgi:hypothetical protein
MAAVCHPAELKASAIDGVCSDIQLKFAGTPVLEGYCPLINDALHGWHWGATDIALSKTIPL